MMDANELPPLPEPKIHASWGVNGFEITGMGDEQEFGSFYTAEQMREYARAVLALRRMSEIDRQIGNGP